MRGACAVLVAAAAFAVGATAAEPEPYRISGPVIHENLAIYFVHGPSAAGPVPLTLQEALAQGSAQVRETGNVNQLEVENTGDTEVFIQSGDIVKGGRQDRVLTVSLIIPPHSGPMPIASFCVEQGRWSGRGKEDAHRFATANTSVPSREAKIAMKAPVAAPPAPARSRPSYMSSLDVSRRQQEMWNDVAKTQDKLARAIAAPVAMPESRSSLQLSLENEKLKEAQAAYVKALKEAGEAADDIIGYVFAINGKLNSADLYPSNGLFRKMWPKLLDANAVEAIGDKSAAGAAPPSDADVLAFLKAAEAGKAVEQPLTKAIKLETREAAGALFFESRRVPSAPGADAAWVHRNYIAK
jgi:ARG and Rhodanese-Phosphatase-superfamily-associated Protein domain